MPIKVVKFKNEKNPLGPPADKATATEISAEALEKIQENSGDYVDALAATLGTSAAKDSGVAGEVGKVLASDDSTIGLSIMAFGAKWDGVTDDSEALKKAIEASVAAGGIPVLLPRGTGCFKKAVPIPKNLTVQVPIRGAGMRATTIKLEGTFEWLEFVATVAGDTVGNVDLSDLTVDGNNEQVTESKSRGVVISAAHNGFTCEQVNIKNVRIRRVRTINVPNLEAKENGRRNVVLTPFHATPGLAKNVIERIHISECEFNGGQYGVFIGGTGGGGGGGGHLPVNVYMAHIYIGDCKHDCGAPAAAFGSCANFQLGQNGWSDGKNIVIERLYGANSSDVGVELDVPCTARDLEIVNTNDAALLLNTFNPATTKDPIVTKLTAKAAVGTTKLEVTSSAAFTVGEQVVLYAEEAEVRTIKAKGEGFIELTEATGIEHVKEAWVQQVDDMSAAKWRIDNLKVTRTVTLPGGQCGFAIQNTENPIPMPEIEVEGYLYHRTAAGLPGSQGEIMRAQYGTTNSPTGNPRALRVRRLQADIINLEHPAAGKSAYSPFYMAMLGNHMPLEVQGEVNISGPGVTGGGQMPTNLFKAFGSAILDIDLIMKAVIGSTGGEPLRFACFNEESKAGDMGGRTRLRVRTSSITAGGGALIGVRYGKACGFAQKAAATTTTAKVEAGKVLIPVVSAAGFAAGDAIVLDALSTAKSEVLLIEKIEGNNITAVSIGEAPGAAVEHAEGATVARLNQNVVVDSDFTGLGTEGTEIATEDEKVRMRLLAKQIRWAKAQGIKVLAIPATGKAFQILQPGQSGTVFVEGGTVSSIEWSALGIAYWKLAAGSGFAFKVSPGDLIKIAYTVAPTNVKFQADRA